MAARLVVLVVLVVLASSACSNGRQAASDSGPAGDSGPLPDTGRPAVDSGPLPDTGQLPVDSGPPQDAWVAQSPLVDPHCLDGMYTETLPMASVDVSDLVASYAPASVNTFVDQVLMRRYPLGRQLVMEGLARQDCIAMFLNDSSTATAVIAGLDTVVHECGHIADNARSAGAANAYVINPSLVLMASEGDTTARGGQTFARSLIRGDAYYALRPACPMGTFDPSCDQYADIYLDGSPTDGVFQSGDQGFNLLLEEAVQYTNSLATAYAFNDYARMSGFSSSQRDGILTFLWYVERYLHMARTSYPSAYDLLLNGSSGQWRQAILTVWGRAWIFLQATSGMSDLGIGDTMIAPLVMDPVLLDEINRLRMVQCP